MRHEQGDVWLCEGDDPQFSIRGGLAPFYALIEITGVGVDLDVRVYGAEGARHDEARALEIAPARHVAIGATFPAAAFARRPLRIDPADRPCRIHLRLRRFADRAQFERAHARAAERGVATMIGARSSGGWTLRRPRAPQRLLLHRNVERIWALGATVAPPSARPFAHEGPLLSFLTPVHDAAPEHLDDLRRSFRAQHAGLAELILSDDGSTRESTAAWLDGQDARGEPDVRILRHPRNRGIAVATNAALEAARGRWVAMVDHDDMIAPHAAAVALDALARAPRARFLYTDEVIVDEALRPTSIFLKPAFDPVLLSGVNYVNHLSVYERERLVALGGLAEGFEGAQDYELVLRYCRGLAPEEIAHLPYPAYIWRQSPTSFSHSRLDRATDSARRALSLHYGGPDRMARAGPAELISDLHRVAFAAPAGGPPRVSVIIPNRDSPELMEITLRGLLERTDYPALEVIVVDNGSTDPRTLALYDRAARAPTNFRVDIESAPFNFSAMVNRGVALARGQHVLLLNNDVEVLHPDWLREMTDCLAYSGVGIVGAKLLYPDRRIQHAGVILGLGGLAGHWFYKARETTTGPMGRLALRNGVTVVTGACMLISRECLDAVGPFDEARFQVAYNDVDYCARAREKGFGVVWTPFATLIHHESASRGSDKDARNAERFAREKAALRDRHATDRFEDPCHSPWWSRFQSRPRFRTRADLPGPRSFMGG